MADNDEGRVSTRDFYNALLDTNRQIADLRTIMTDIQTNQNRNKEALDILANRDTAQQGQIDDLKMSDKKWGAINAAFAALVAFLAGMFKP